MSPQQSERKYSPIYAGLAACVLGLALCPFFFVAVIGYVGTEWFGPVFWYMAPPPLLCSSYLFYRFLGTPKEQAACGTLLATKILSWLMAILSWLVIAAFVSIASLYGFAPPSERIGISLTYFLLGSLLCLPVVLMRKTALQQRLMRLPGNVALWALVLVVSLSASMVVNYLLTPSDPLDFIGGHRPDAVPLPYVPGNLINGQVSNISVLAEKYNGYVVVINSGPAPITIRSVLFNHKPDCSASKPVTPVAIATSIELRVAEATTFAYPCNLIKLTVQTDQGSATFKFDR